MKKLKEILSRPFLFIGLTIAVILLLVISALDENAFYDNGSAFPDFYFSPENAEDYAFSENGFVAVNEYSSQNSLLVCGDLNSGKMQYMLGRNELFNYCGIASRKNIIYGDRGELFLHYVTWSENAQSAIDHEYIVRILPDGTPQDILCGFSYNGTEDPPTRSERLSGFCYHDFILEFAYIDTEKTEFYALDTRTGTQTCTAVYEAEEDGRFISLVFPLENYDYLLVFNDGAVYRTAVGEPLEEPIFQCTVNFEDAFETDLIKQAVEVDGVIYVTAGYYTDTVYALEDGELFSVTDMEELSGSEETDEITKLYALNDTLMICTADSVFAYQKENFKPLDLSFRITSEHLTVPVINMTVEILLILDLIALISFLILVRKNLLLKQLLMILPIAGIVSSILLLSVKELLFDTYYSTMTDGMIADCELTARTFDGDFFNEIDTTDMASYLEVRKHLLKYLRHNRGFWEGSYDFKLWLPANDGSALAYVDTASVLMPFYELTFDCDPEELELFQVIYSDSAYYATYSPESSIFDTIVTRCTVVTPIWNSENQVTAYLMMTTDSFDLDSQKTYYIHKLLKLLIMLSALLILITTAISIFVSRTIKKTITVVNQISKGDFSVRVEKAPDDELGDICRQVNFMAGNLESMFREKDENERFYYKFVPEKFRELLGKEKLTELALGDATSREFTVLFCDIRSFSLNSEMLTAAENFEFVNIIYGIAGPIIRKYGGFVDKYIGDAVMALFESADSAVNAGIELYRAIVLDPHTAERLNVSEINIGVGIHTGMARIGIVGEEERLSGTVISNTVNLSSRLESLTKTYQTAMLISKDTLDKMHSAKELHMRYLGMVQVAGVNEVKSIYEVLDCLDEKRRAVRSENAPDLREAVRLFHMGRRTEASELLKKIQSDGKADHTVSMYLDYIKQLNQEDKGNVFRFLRK